MELERAKFWNGLGRRPSDGAQGEQSVIPIFTGALSNAGTIVKRNRVGRLPILCSRMQFVGRLPCCIRNDWKGIISKMAGICMLATLTIRQLDFNIDIFISTKHDVDFSIGGTLLGGGLFVLSLDLPLKLNYLLAQRSFLKKEFTTAKEGKFS